MERLMKQLRKLSILVFAAVTLGQFGQNIVQYDDFDWAFIQSRHFDIYYSGDGRPHAEFVAVEAERAYDNIGDRMGWKLRQRVSIIVYNSHNDFQQTNVIDSYMYEGVGGVTELYKNRIVIPFDGSHREFKHVIHHELVHAFINDNIYGGNLQNMIAQQIKFMIPGWMNEGLAEYLSDGWSTNSDMWIRDLAINGGDLPEIYYMNGYMAYRGGQSVWRFIADKWGEESFSEIFYQIKKLNNVNKGFEKALGVDIEDLSEQWKEFVKKEYWPDITGRDKLDDVARRLTDHEKLKNSYNIAPAISPDGSQIAIISNKGGSFAIHLIASEDGIFNRKVIQGEQSAEYEELHILKPGIAWSPDGESIAFGVKSGKSDALVVADVISRKTKKFRLGMEGVFRPSWSPTRNEIAFIGNDGVTSNIYLFDLDSETLSRLTDDWFTDDHVTWAPDGESLLFISDRGDRIDIGSPEDPMLHEIDQMDIFSISRSDKIIRRLTNTEYDELYPVYSSDGSKIAFVSDESGINNIYLMAVSTGQIKAITNVLTGVSQLSWSSDDSHLAFSGFEKSGYDIYLLSNPLDLLSEEITVEPAAWTFEEPQEQLRRPKTKELEKVTASYDNYVFENYGRKTKKDTTNLKIELADDQVQDSSGTFLSHPYKTRFTLDIIQGYYAFSTQYSPEAMAYFLWSDILGDHRIFVGTEMQISLKNSDYYLMYSYLPKKIDYNFMFLHNAEGYGYYDGYGFYHLQRLRQIGLGIQASAPYSRFSRVELGFETSYVELAEIYEQLIPGSSYQTEYSENIIETMQTIIPSLGYVWDNTRWFQTYPITGSRFYTRLEVSSRFGNDNGLDFQTLSMDYRKYFSLFNGISFAGRVYAGKSYGRDAINFRVGGVPWLFSSENDYYKEYPNYSSDLDILQGMYFTKYIMPVRGGQINEVHGENAVVINTEIRLPFLIYYFPTIKFIGQLNMVFFSDFGMAWTGAEPDMRIGNSIKQDANDFVWTYGFGPRFIFLGLPWQLDYAWEIHPEIETKRMWYLSIGLDF